MIRFFQGIKRAADWFNVNPDGLSFVTERRLKDLEASVSRLPKAISDRNFTSIMNLEYDIYELKETIKTFKEEFDDNKLIAASINSKEIFRALSLRLDNLENAFGKLEEHIGLRDHTQLQSKSPLPMKEAKPLKKPKSLKLSAVEEEVKTVESKLTQKEVNNLFEYRDGELYWKVSRSNRVKVGDKIGRIVDRGRLCVIATVGSTTTTVSRIVFLMFHGYLPERVCFIDDNPLNTRIENLKAATCSQVACHSKTQKNNVSGYKGVSINSKTGLYKAQIYKKGKLYYLGSYNTAFEAHKAYCKAAKKLHGEFARLT